MGDPTIRMHVVAPVKDLVATQEGLSVRLAWHGPKAASGFFIYRKYNNDSDYQLLNAQEVTDSSYIDACVQKGLISYLVRATALKTSGSGSYYNLSSGVSTAIVYDTTAFTVQSTVQNVDPGQSNGSIKITASGSCSPYSYLWANGQTTAELGDLSAGKYCVTISDCLNCTQEHCAIVNESTATESLPGLASLQLFPNPCSNQLFLQLILKQEHKLALYITDVNGIRRETKHAEGTDIKINWDTESLVTGKYWMHIIHESGHFTIPFTKSSQ